MELAIAERFICPCGRTRMPLVVRADAADAGVLSVGVAGCPSCITEWALTADRVVFDVMPAGDATPFDDADAAVALLRIAEPGLLVWLDGVTSRLASELVHAGQVRAVLADTAPPVEGALHVDGAAQVPFAGGTFHAALVLRPDRDAAYLASVAASLATGGRLVASASLPVPPGIRELGRAGTIWVGEHAPAATPVPLRRGR